MKKKFIAIQCGENIEMRLESQIKIHKITIKVYKIMFHPHQNFDPCHFFFDPHQNVVDPRDLYDPCHPHYLADS